MAKSKRHIKRRKNIKNKEVKEFIIPDRIQKLIDKISDETIDIEERQNISKQLFGDDGKLRSQFYQVRKRKIK